MEEADPKTGRVNKVLDPVRAPLIKKTFELYSTGKKLEKQGIAPILRNVFYTGKIKSKGEIYQDNHEPIIDEKTFLLCG